MLRRALFVLAGIAVAAFLATDRSPRAAAADPEVAGNWQLSYSPQAGFEQTLAIIKVEAKDGKTVASILSGLKGANFEITKFESDAKVVKFSLNIGWSFEGSVGKDGKVVVGSIGPDQTAIRAKLTRTDKTELDAAAGITRTDAPAPMAAAQKLTSAVAQLRAKARVEKDADAKKELVEKIDVAQKEADEKLPALLREVVAKHGDTPFALDAIGDLLRNANKYKLTADEVAKLLSQIEQLTIPYGPRFSRFQMLAAVETVVTQKGLAGSANAATERLAKTPGLSDDFLSRALSARKVALETLGKLDEAKAVGGELAKLEEKIDAEYVKKVPPFKPEAFTGRKDKAANQVVVMELFTGAQCPPCVAADVAFDALQKAYKPTDLVLIQYHLHIPGPDPLTNADTVARAEYYGVNSTPTTLFNGKKAAAGGGGMANAEGKYKQYLGVIDPLLEKSADVKMAGKVTRKGEKLDIAVQVAGAEGDDVKLRLLVVEETVKYVGGNQLRFHHQVVRAMPGGAEGVAIKDKAFKHTAAVDFGAVKKGLTQYLDEFAANGRAFPKPDRPMDMKAVRVIALVQNDKTKEILQAVQLDVEGQTAGGH